MSEERVLQAARVTDRDQARAGWLGEVEWVAAGGGKGVVWAPQASVSPMHNRANERV